ncbi:DUF6383 domain-containing protein [Parabacteroides gordonii]|uniref:DUF6383 domain-containing protein n=1 Tax=Parabacteroides gordonii TaxID=574930 RepID=UPI0026EED4F2|nr:DUF6383 domain-containing protein [Parabacteroides gordonii]
MNKKLSLMMAALIAAGYSVTAEAGVVKVTTPAANAKYVIAVNNFTLAGSELALTTEGDGFAGKDIEAITDAELWTVSTATTAGKISNVSTKTFIQSGSASLGDDTGAATFTAVNPLAKGSGAGDYFHLLETPAWNNSGSNQAYLYAVTKPIHAKASVVYLQKDGKYAVNTSGTTVIYLDGATIAMLGLQNKATFSVDENGVIYNEANEVSAVAAAGGISLTATTDRKNFVEIDQYNSDKNVYVTATGTTTTTAAAEHFAVTTTLSTTPQVPAGALAWTNGTTGVLYVNPAGDASDPKEIKDDGSVNSSLVENKALTIKLNADGSYSLFNGNAQVALQNEVSFTIVKAGNGFILKKADGKILTINSTNLTWKDDAADGDAVAVFSFSKGTLVSISAADLAKIENGGITLTASYDNGKTDIKGNPFTGFLTVEPTNDTRATGDNFRLKSGKKYIVGRKDMIEGAGTVAWGFTTVDKLSDMKDSDISVFNAKVYAGETTPSEIVLYLGNNQNNKVGYYKVPGAVYMGAGTSPKDVTFSLGTGTLARWQDVLQKNKFFTIEKISNYSADDAKAEGYLVADDKTAPTPTPGQSLGDLLTYSKTVRNVLEGEWALTLNDAKDKYVFTNRETPTFKIELLSVNSLYTTTSEYTYVSGADKYIITPVANHAATDGYKTLDQLEMQRFNIGSYAGVYDNTAWFTENHGEDKDAEYHVIGLNIDQEEGLIYEAIAHDQKRDKDHVVTDSIYVVSTIGYYNAAINNYDEVLDTLKVVSYTFKNQYNEPLYVASTDEDFSKPTYVSSAKENAADPAKATKFTLRLDTDNTLNLRPVALKPANGAVYNTFAAATDFKKAYAGSSLNKGLVSSTDLYEREENDRFVVAPLAYEMYRRLENAVPGTSLDTISIFREGNNKEVLFENGQFLGMNNQVQFPAIAPAMVVDSAYAPANTYRPQYMLMVEPNYVPAGKWCPEHGFNPGCSHEQDIEGYTEGRYLVNLKDTAIAWEDANKHGGINPYTNTEGYVKLAFVPAKHIKDTLIINSDNNKLTVNTAAFNEAKFAFRYVDATAKSFVIETADFYLTGKDAGKIKTTPGYLKWMNGVIVVVDDIKNADVYNMDEEYAGNPTANEGINASSVEVIAGNGVVTINGAAGKKVVISNVLGQTIANAVLSSDNATISAPAGIVVVAIEGEAAVKAIVK